MAFYFAEFVIIAAKIHPEFVKHNVTQESVRGLVAKSISRYAPLPV